VLKARAVTINKENPMATIVGTSAAETLGNNAGQDDTITGLAGHDTFIYSRSGASQTDTLTDFGSMYFSASANGAQEVPANGSSATASLTAALSRGNDALSFSLDIVGLDLGGQIPGASNDIQAIHFHNAPPGSNGSIVFGFVGAPNNDTDGDTDVDAPGFNVTGEWDAAEGNAGTSLTAQIANLLAGNLYVNIHTQALPGGEIRGQIGAVDSGLDKLDVTAANIGEWTTMQFLLEDSGGSTQFTTALNGNDHTMVLQGVLEANLSSADFIFAGSVAESIAGTNLNDDLFGAGAKDKIKGLKGEDRLFGESGGDILTGGAGQDMLFGGSGADKFSYAKAKDSKVGANNRDVIADFAQGQDRVDLEKIDADTTQASNQSFFLGGSAFTSQAGELIQNINGNGDTILEGDNDGDGDADFQIELTGGAVLDINDFLF
jgi:Ca2+-binding RTX toxin-like protein